MPVEPALKWRVVTKALHRAHRSWNHGCKEVLISAHPSRAPGDPLQQATLVLHPHGVTFATFLVQLDCDVVGILWEGCLYPKCCQKPNKCVVVSAVYGHTRRVRRAVARRA
eukprot:1182701-Prorocentrum_minimum.AAC.1